MEGLRESTAVSDTVSSTIPGPYVSPERNESIPLKGTPSSSSSFLSRCCKNCMGFADDEAGDGLKFIIVTFFILSVAVTVALFSQIYQGDFQVVPHGSVATDNLNCSLIGTDILKKGGNAVDAAVASTFCMGVVNPHITGLGGGGFALVYDHRRNEILTSLDFRESAPLRLPLSIERSVGPSTVGVPGLVSGLFAVHKSFGKLSWQDVVRPAADIAKSGFLIPSSLNRTQLPPRNEFNGMLHDFLSLEAGEKLKNPTLAASLELIAKEGPNVFYNGSIAKEILTAIQGSSTLTSTDLSSYAPVQRESLHEDFYGFDVIVPGAPSGGPLLLAALRSISSLNLTDSISEESIPLLLYRQAHAIQENYPFFLEESGDPDFNSETPANSYDYPSVLPETVASHVAAVDLNDLYVSIVSGHNSVFGSQVMTEGGFLLNNALASFDIHSVEKPSAASQVTFTTANPPLANPSDTASLPSRTSISENSSVVDHLPPSRPDSAYTLQWHKGEVSNINPSPLSPRQSFLKRRKRFESAELGPRATVWGSSVAKNNLVGGKRPVSLATPVIAVERGQICGRRLILGGSDAGVTAQVLSQLLVLDGNSNSSIEFPRVKLSETRPNILLATLSVGQAYRLSPVRLRQLADLGIRIQPSMAPEPSVNIVEKVGDMLLSYSDSRGEGLASRF